MEQLNGSWTDCKMTQLHQEQNSTARCRYSRNQSVISFLEWDSIIR